VRQLALLLAALLLPVSPAAAVIYAFSGTLTSVPADGSLVAGGQFLGNFVVDEGGPNSGSAQDGRFALQDFYNYLDVGVANPIESINSGFVRVGVGVDTPDGIADVFSAEDKVGSFTGFDLQGLGDLPTDYVFRVSLVRTGGGLFSQPANVATDLTLADFNFGTLTIGPEGGSPVIAGTINSFGSASVALVPEPATWLMLISGFGLVGVVARRQQRREGRLLTVD